MKQFTFADTLVGFGMSQKRTRKREFLEQMDKVGPWAELVGLIEQHAPAKTTGRPRIAIESMLRIHFLQQWFSLSDPAKEEALLDVPLFHRFARLDCGEARMPDESTILRFRYLLEQHGLGLRILETVNGLLQSKELLLKSGTVVDATLIAAPSSTKNSSGKRDPEMRQTKKGNQWHFGMKAHIGADADSGLVHAVMTTSANVQDVRQAHELLHGRELDVYADAGYRGVEKRTANRGLCVRWHVALLPGQRRALDTETRIGRIKAKLELLKAKFRAKVEHPVRVIKRQFGYIKVRYRGLANNTAQIQTLFALSNLWMTRHKLLAGAA